MRALNRIKPTHLISAFIVCIFSTVLACCLAQPAAAQLTAGSELEAESISYLPDVTEEMSHASYWSSKQGNPDAILAGRTEIDRLNQTAIDADGTMLQPLKNAYERFYTEEEQLLLKESAASELSGAFIEQVYDLDGNILTKEDADEILANYPTDGKAPELASGYAVVTTHTTGRCFPTDRPLMYDKEDADDDNLYLSMLRVNEPLLVRAQSVDGKYLLCTSSCLSASWVPAEDVAICAETDDMTAREQWLDAWDIPAGHELVVYGYKVRTEQTRVLPNTANRMLYMGTVLESIDWDVSELIGTRSAYNNHVCYLPVRNDDGTYSKEVALIAQSEKVSEGYLPLTTSNIASVAFNSLGQMYGWGGMLEANDCSGYVRDVYKCFGLELARNTTWQMNLPVRKYDLTGLDDEQKAAAIAQMPLGTVLFWGAHEMIYLGQENGKLYVISSVGSVGNLFGDTGITQVKGVLVNTLDMVRGNRTSWLSNLTTANIPYIPSEPAAQTITATNVTKSVKASEKTGKLTKKKTLKLKKLAGVSAQTDVRYEKKNTAGKSYITVDSSSGKMTLKKGLKRGTYNVKVMITAQATDYYQAAEKLIRVKVTVE